MENAVRNPKDKWIPFYFVLFFAVIAVLDGIFVYMAVSTQTGVVTEQAYEEGLAYNDVLAGAAARPAITQKASYENGFLRWQLTGEDGKPLTDAIVTADIIRPVQDGYDFDITLSHKGNGLYETKLDTPFYGQWRAKLEGTWNNDQQYRTTFEFIVK